MTIGLITPNNYFAPWAFVQSVLSLPPRYPFLSVSGHSVPHNRNRIWERLNGTDDLLFIDADMTFTPEDVQKIEEHLKTRDIITGVYLLADETYALFKQGQDDYEHSEPEQGIFKIAACGAGFLGISKRIMKKLPENPFSNLWEGAIQHGEDISFCHRANEAGTQIWCDSSIRLGHIRTKILKP